MKTVMKKMFSLLLVAVLLVSAVPTAFADDEVKCTHCQGTNIAPNQALYGKEATCDEDGTYGYYCHDCAKSFTYGTITKLGHEWGTPYLSVEPTCTATGVQVKKCDRCGEIVTTNSSVSTKPHDFGDATCTEPGKCTVCGTPSTDQANAALGHAWVDATCTAPKTCSRCGTTEGAAAGHSYGDDTVCDVCKVCNLCGKTIENGDADHDVTCRIHPEFHKHCDLCGEDYTAAESHPVCTICENKYSSTCHATANCPYCEVCLAKGNYVKDHETADHCPKCGNTDGTHKTTCEKAVCSICNGAHDAANCPNDGDYDLKIYGTMWTGDGREETIYLGTFYNLTTNTKIAEYMNQNSDRINDWVAAKCSSYKWNDRKIYENKYSTDEIEWNDRMGYSDQEAYINVTRGSKDVVLFLHTARTYVDHDWIKVEGKTTNDTLTLEEAQKIVKKYYNFSNLKMYSNDRWNEYVDGNNNIEPENTVTIGSGNVTKIHILMSGSSAKTSSGTNSNYTADSSNPKTGDMIFAPVAVMGLSVSALAVLFFLNKKRAY